jgi:hypothetical protein
MRLLMLPPAVYLSLATRRSIPMHFSHGPPRIKAEIRKEYYVMCYFSSLGSPIPNGSNV